MDRGAWQTTVHGVTKSWGRLSKLTLGTFPFLHFQEDPTCPGPLSLCIATAEPARALEHVLHREKPEHRRRAAPSRHN